MSEEIRSSELVNEEAGITMLDGMASAEERLETLSAIRQVSRHREQYWLAIYIERQLALAPKVEFDCLVSASLGPFVQHFDAFPPLQGAPTPQGAEDPALESNSGFLAEALILQLGSFVRYPLFHRIPSLKSGDVIKCHLYKRYTNPVSYVLLPLDMSSETAPPAIVSQLTKRKAVVGGGSGGGSGGGGTGAREGGVVVSGLDLDKEGIDEEE